MPVNRVQRLDEKTGFICLVIMCTPGVKVIKMSKMAPFFIFSADDSKKLFTVWSTYLSASERS